MIFMIFAWGSRTAPASSRGSEGLSEVLRGCPDIPKRLVCVLNHQKQPRNHPGIIQQRLGRHRGALIEIQGFSMLCKKTHTISLIFLHQKNSKLYISLPGIGEYRVPIIFVNKKSNFSIKNLNNSITTLLVVFPAPLEPYFCLGKNQRSKFANFILPPIPRGG